MKEWLEIQFWEIAKWLIRRGYGANCEMPDYIEFPEYSRALNASYRCASCQAKEVIEWIDEHLILIRS